MTFRKSIFMSMALFAAGIFQAAAQERPYVILSDNRKMEGIGLTAAADGTLTLQVDAAGVRSTFRPNQVKMAYTPKPDEVAKMEQAFQSRRYSEVLQAAGAAFSKYRYLGWGDMIAYLEGMCHVRQNRFDEGLKSFQKGRPHAGLNGALLLRGAVEALIGLKKYSEAQQNIGNLIKSGDPANAAFGFNAKGRILVEQNKKKEAALEYMKCIFVIGKQQAPEQFQDAKQSVVALLKEMNHPRLADFEKL